MRDLKLKIIGYGTGTKTSEVEKAVNVFLAAVKVEKVEVVPFLGSVVIHIFYYGDDPFDTESEGQ